MTPDGKLTCGTYQPKTSQPMARHAICHTLIIQWISTMLIGAVDWAYGITVKTAQMELNKIQRLIMVRFTGDEGILWLGSYLSWTEPVDSMIYIFVYALHTYIYIYIIGHYNPSVRIIDLVSHTTFVVCVNFILKWRDLQFKVDSERQIF